MILHTVRENHKARYCIQEMDKGRDYGEIAYYDCLEQAAIVLRYLKGGNMPKEDQQTALRYIFEWDARETMKEDAAE